MRALHLTILAAVFAIPSVTYSQDSGMVGGKVGADLGSISPAQPSPTGGHPYGAPLSPSPSRAGFAGRTTPGQLVPEDVPVMPRPGGQGTAFVNGHRVLVDPNSNRILRVFN